MHALHSLAHRAPPATRRVRWQPYASGSSSSSVSSRPSPSSYYLNTPSSSVPSSPEIPAPPNNIDCSQQPSSLPLSHSKDLSSKGLNRSKHATNLVDQAVKSLCEIWRPQDIPLAFVASARTMMSGCEPVLSVLPHTPARNRGRGIQQLPSPISPSTRSSPSPSVTMSSPTLVCLSTDSDRTSLSNPRGNLVPMKAFVHEVLRRSRTSGCVLQTALCYLEALRTKVPELAQQERLGEGVKGELDTSDWITPATEAELKWEAELATRYGCTMKTPHSCEDDIMATVRVHDDDLGSTSATPPAQEDAMPGHEAHQRLLPGPTLSPLPPLPSPLLCPRRAFLASLILASKFTQDKCYSNRAWAKLSGLPPREIGRCERALGEALEWRLWVGKQPPALQPSSPPTTHRPVVRSQSEGSLFAAPSFFTKDEKSGTPPASSSLSANNGLRRCATLPVDIYGPLVAPPSAPPSTQPSLARSALSYTDLPHDATHRLNHPPIVQAKSVELYPQAVEHSQYTDKISQSPSPETPSLSYSPSSTESGDHTINSSSFLDDPMGAFNSGKPGIEPWLWSDPSDIAPCLPKTPSPHFPSSTIGCVNPLPAKAPHDFVATGTWIVENGLAC